MGLIRYGTSSWSEKSWVGPFYPKGTAPGDYLNHYATQFTTVEADVTYYRIPDERLVRGWDDKTPDDFVLTAKFPRSIVHCGDGPRPNPDKLLVPEHVADDTHRFLDAMRLLGPKCGPLVLQFPYFNKQAFQGPRAFEDRLAGFLDRLPDDLRYAVEIRNKHWLKPRFLELLRERNVALVLLDLVYMPHPDTLTDDLDLATSDFTVVRLIGDRKAVDERTDTFDEVVLDQSSRLTRWARLLESFASEVEISYVYANNHYAGHGPATIRELADQLPHELLSLEVLMNPLAAHWQLDKEITFLNHGSFGACPTAVLQHQRGLQDELEAEPLAFFIRGFEDRLNAVRDVLGAFVGAPGEELVFVNNATTGVNTVLRSLSFEPGAQLLTTDHVYNACRNVMDFVAEQHGAEVVIAKTPFPVSGPDEVFDSVMSHVTDKTKFALLDHITSPTGIILPVERLVPALRERGIEVMVDGAHAPGMVDLDISALGAHYYTGNCHKWVCAPKGAAFLYVQRNRQPMIRPLSISHGANSPRTDRSRFLLEFDWPGTDDPTPWLSIPKAIEFLGSLFEGGWPELRASNHALLLQGRDRVCAALGIDAPAPDSMLGTLAAMPLPDGDASGAPNPLGIDPLQDVLFHEYRIEVPVMPWPAPPGRMLRISAQAYNEIGEYEKLAAALVGRV